MKKTALLFSALMINICIFSQTYRIAETGQTKYYNASVEISTPAESDVFYGQDACYTGNALSYTDNGDGTVTDNVTGLMWAQTCDLNGDGTINANDKLSYTKSLAAADTFSLAGYNDWRLPSIKEQYSLIVFNGIDPSGYEGDVDGLIPFVDTDYFDFGYGDEDAGERIIDAQMATSTLYVSTTMMGDETMFGVNFADGRIKGYGTGPMPGQTEDKEYYVYFVRGNTQYGINDFEDNSDGTITDNATGLMWTKNDNEEGLTWEQALNYAKNSEASGHTDWRLPNAKELQSIIDYTRSPATTSSAAIDPIFNCSTIIDESDETNYPFYWTGTTHANWTTDNYGNAAAYLCFGEALGFMEMPPESGTYNLLDVHGAGSQRSDPKTGNPDDYPYGNGPQGDVIRIYNYVRLVRDVEANSASINSTTNKFNISPNPGTDNITIYEGTNSQSFSIKIYDQLGKHIKTLNNVSSGNSVNISYLDSGIYIICCVSEKSTNNIRFIKQ